MKKIIYLIFCFIIFSSTTKAFLGEDLWINLYKNINEGIVELELKQYEYELKWQWDSIKDNINNILSSWYQECIWNDINSSDVEKISAWDISVLYNNIAPECLDENGSISNLQLYNIAQMVRYINQETKEKAILKTKQLNNISKIWIYSDWNTENSPFDLVTDLQNIDYYIFTEEIPYNWEVLENNDELIEGILWLDNNKWNWSNSLNWLNSLDWINLANNENNNFINNQDWENNNSTSDIQLKSNYKCIDNATNSELSWLSEDEITKLISGDEYQSIENNESLNWTDINNNEILNELELTDELKTEYKWLNDNWVYPCTTFFCITIEFITYQHNLLGWGNNISIEYLINRSNKHLKTFAASSLIQAEMTSNNWELWLKDLNFPDIFHVWFIISKKPIPILDIELDEDKEKKTKHTKENLLEEYYKNYWLEYSRKNDMKLFEWNYDEIRTVLNLAELSIWETNKKIQELKKINNEKQKQNDFVSKEVFQKIWNEELKDFEKRFVELRKFSSTINEYINTIDGIVRFINEIKIDKW